MFCRACATEMHESALACPKCGATVNAPAAELSSSMRTWGWILAFVFPLGGIIIGIVALTRRAVGTGIAMIIVSLLMLSFWSAFWPAFAAAS